MKKLFGITLALLALAAPTWAGTVYVPLVVDQLDAGGTLVTTEIHLTNTSRTELKGFTYLVLPSMTDGTDRAEDAGTDVLLQPLSTFVLRDLVAAGESAMLEVDADREIAVSARLIPVAESGAVNMGVALPIATSSSLIPAGEDGQVQGWDRVGGEVVTDFHILNLGAQEASCASFVQRENGTALVNGFQFVVPPLSQRTIPDVLNLIGQNNVENITAYFNCDQPSFPFSSAANLVNGQYRVQGPSASGRSTLLPPGQTDPPIAGATVYEQSGVFHTPTVGNESKHFDVPMPGNPSFSKVVVEMDFTHGGWNVPTNFNHAIFWLNRGNRWRSNNFGYVNTFGPGTNTVKLITNAGLPAGVVQPKEVGAVLNPGSTYHVYYEYDTNINRILLQITQNGNPVVTLTDVPTVNRVATVDNNWFLAFGHETGAVGPEVPTYGWSYANLRVQWVP